MRRMYSEKQLKGIIADSSDAVVEALEGQEIEAESVHADEIIENMEGYSFAKQEADTYNAFDYTYAGVVKNGNKITFALALKLTRVSGGGGYKRMGTFTIPQAVFNKLYPVSIDGTTYMAIGQVDGVDTSTKAIVSSPWYCFKETGNKVAIALNNTNMSNNEECYIRFEITFLLSENLAE